MANPPSRWTALVAEAVLIVVSILLAFAIDAGWDRRVEQARRLALLADLRSDFAATSAALEGAIAEGQEDLDRTDGFLRIVGEAEAVSRGSLVTLFSGVDQAVFFQPTVASYRSALSDGSIALLRSAVLTKALTDFDLQVDLYQLHLGISGDLFFLGAVQDFRVSPIFS